MGDPLSEIMDSGVNPYGITPTMSQLKRLYELSSPHYFLESVESLLERVVVLEMFLEEQRELSISTEELKDFRDRNLPRIQKQADLLAGLMFGSVARKEGG